VEGIAHDLEPYGGEQTAVHELFHSSPDGYMGIKLAPGNLTLDASDFSKLPVEIRNILIPSIGGQERP
jgi:hypothetical protein